MVTKENWLEFRELVTNQKNFFLNKYRYLKKIESGSIHNKEEIEDFLVDLNLNVNIATFQIEILPKLLEETTIKYKFFIELDLLSDKNDKNISLCAFLVEHELLTSEFQKNVSINKQYYSNEQSSTIFHSHTLLKRLDSLLKPILPQYHSYLTKIIQFNNKQVHNSQSSYLSCSVVICWQKLRQSLEADIHTWMRDVLSKETLIGVNKNQFAECVTDLTRIAPLVKGQNQKNLNSNLSTVKLLETNITFFYELLIPALTTFLELFEQIKNDIKQISQSEKIKIQKLEKLNKLHGHLIERFKIIDKKIETIKKIHSSNYLHNMFEERLELGRIIESISSDIAIYTDSSSFESENVIQKMMELDNSLTLFNASLNFYFTQSRSLSSPTTVFNVINQQSKQMKLDAAKEKEVFLRHKNEKLAEYKESIRLAREQQLTNKLSTVEIQKPQQQPVTYFVNPMMDILLNDLSLKKITLLKSILNCDRGLAFDSVCFLLTNHLNAKISEIGNGSSHKRIEIENYRSTKASEANTTSVGGFYKPHGKDHNPGILSPFNLSLINTTLNKAGITIDLIESLEEKIHVKRSDKSSARLISVNCT